MPRPVGRVGASLCGLTFLVLASCSTTQINKAPSARTFSFEEIKERVAREKGLAFDEPLVLETVTARELLALQKKSLEKEYADDKLLVLERVYKRFGLLPRNAEWPALLAEFRLQMSGAVHDPAQNKIFISGEPWRYGASLLRALRGAAPSEAETQEFLIARALARVLDARNMEERFQQAATEDFKLAAGALDAGESVLAALAGAAALKPDRGKILAAAQTHAKDLDGELRRFPPFLRRTAAFQILEGSAFTSWAFSLKGRQGLNDLRLYPPLSANQILHPAKYYVTPEEPRRILPPALTRRLRSPDLVEETLGEFVIRALLEDSIARVEAGRSATGWSADTLLAFLEGEKIVLAWITAWDRPDDAREFSRSFRRLVQKRLNSALEPAEDHDILVSWSDQGENVLLQVRGTFVLYLDGIGRSQALEIARELWEDLELKPLREPVPLELTNRDLR